MKTIIITPDNEKDFDFLVLLLEKSGYAYKVVSEGEKEDMSLLQMMLKDKDDK